VPIRVAIDGFDGLSRHVLSAVLAGGFSDLFQVAQINAPDGIDAVARRMRLDSFYGRFPGAVQQDGNQLTINDSPVEITSESDREKIEWAKADIDLVVIDSGIAADGQHAQLLLDKGAKKVVVAGKGAEEQLTLVLGINDERYDPDATHVVATGSAAVNALAQLAAVLNASFAAARSVYTLINPVPSTAAIGDTMDMRSGWRNIMPDPDDITPQIIGLLPAMDGKLAGAVLRVPAAPVGWLTLSMETERRLNREEAINCIIEAARSDAFVGVIGHTLDNLVSSDVAGDARSIVVDLGNVTMLGRSFVSVRGWFDAEWAVACRTADVVALICEAGIPGTA
jgi:glyceraldehyde 3-phosphate dehydrogenase